MPTSSHNTFAVPELLESILLLLPPQTLLLSQRVSKAWRAMITTSPRIKDALFLKPRPMSSLAPGEKPEINPCFENIMKRVIYGEAQEEAEEEDEVVVQGIETGKHCEDLGVYHDNRGSYKLLKCDHSFHVHVASRDCADWNVRGIAAGPWRDMLITNPPCPVHFIEADGDWHRSECSALTIGDLVDRMVECCDWGGTEVAQDEEGRWGLDLIADVVPGKDGEPNKRIKAGYPEGECDCSLLYRDHTGCPLHVKE